MTTMMDYLWHLAPSLIYQLTPIGTLVAALICFGILTKYNEMTAFKAAGVSVHRLAAPVIFASFLISGLLFAFDHYYIPAANRRQEMLRAEIKKKPVATYLKADRQWVYGQGSRIYNFLHLDPKQAIMSKVNVFDLDPKTFHVVHQITADRAQWNDHLHAWVFENGVSQETKATDRITTSSTTLPRPSRVDRNFFLVCKRGEGIQGDELRGAGFLYQGAAGERPRHHAVAGAVLQEVRGAPLRRHHGDP